MNSFFQVQLVRVHVFPRLEMCQQRPKWDTWEGESRPSSHVVLFRCRVKSQAQLMLEATSGAEWCRSRPLTMVIVNSIEDTLGLVLWVPYLLNCLYHFSVDPAITPVRATGHQLVTLCRSVCAEKRAQILDPLMGSKYLTMCFITFLAFFSSLCSFFKELDAVLQHLGQSAARPGPHVAHTSDSSADESKASHSRRRVRSKRTFKMKKVWRLTRWVSSSSLGLPMQLANRSLSIVGFVVRMSRWVLTHGPHEILRHYQGVKHFARDQRLRLETPGWRVLDFEGNPFSENELERRKEHILRGPLVVRDREYPFAEDSIIDESRAPAATLPVVAKVSSLIEILRLGGPYELVNQL